MPGWSARWRPPPPSQSPNLPWRGRFLSQSACAWEQRGRPQGSQTNRPQNCPDRILSLDSCCSGLILRHACVRFAGMGAVGAQLLSTRRHDPIRKLTATVSVQITDFSISRAGCSSAIHRQHGLELDVDGTGSVTTGKAKPRQFVPGKTNKRWRIWTESATQQHGLISWVSRHQRPPHEFRWHKGAIANKKWL